MVNEELHELLDGFVSESIDSLDDNEMRIARLDQDDPAEDLKALFRVFHTLKGLSGFFELNIINKVTHEAETLLDIFRENPHPLKQETIDLLYVVFDFLYSAVNYVGENLTDEPLKEKAFIIIEQLETKIELENKSLDDKSDENPDSEEDSQVLEESFDETDDKFSELVMDIKEEFDKFKQDKENFNLVGNCLDKIKELKETDKIKNSNELNDVTESMNMILEALNEGSIPPDFDTFSIVESDIEVLTGLVDNDEPSENSEESNDFLLDEKTEEIPSITDDDNDDAPKGTEEKAQVEPENLSNEESDDVNQVSKDKSDKSKEESAAVATKKATAVRKEVRVSTDKLNKLFDLVGEIITIESMVINNKDLQGLDLPNFNIAANMLNKLTRELQSVTTSIRMIPLSGAFNKMNRLVRDMSRKFNKKIDLHIFGEETEMDKNLIEEISDPLVHMIRNAIDHGVESPEDRLAKGKPEIGKVTLGAAYQGNEIHIIIEDDGAGLDREKILKKAVTKGLVTGDPNELSDGDVWKLIFEPGLSTAEKVTDVSGRGVGMDVVKKNIEKLRGSIDITSKENEGTRLTFRIPLTLAIMDALIIRTGQARYAIPILSVRESFQPKRKDITTTMDGVEMVKVRNDLYPIVKLYEIMNIDSQYSEPENAILMVIQSNEKVICLQVDEIIGQTQAVLKPLSEYIGDVQGVTGCMVMSDGKIGLILDVDSLIEKSENFISKAELI